MEIYILSLTFIVGICSGVIVVIWLFDKLVCKGE